MNEDLVFRPLNIERWDDFAELFGPRGAYGGCWCMWWRKTRKQFELDQGDANREQMHSLVRRGIIPGILAYHEEAPIGWCSVAPREQFASLERSPVLKRIDDLPVWSMVCFYIAKPHRGKGVCEALIRGAVDYALKQGAKIIEAYPTVSTSDSQPPVSVFMGIPRVFERAGFQLCARPSKSKIIMRYEPKGDEINGNRPR
jgi:GNAT superfamily N-acetyltransferase